MEVRGLDPEGVAGSIRFGNGAVLMPTLRLTGTYDGRCLTLIEPPTPVEDGQADMPAELGTACPDPGGAAFTPAERAAAIAYGRAQPDLGQLWMSEHERVLNVSFTGDLRQHQLAIRAIYPGPLCVVEAPVSSADLEAIRHRLHADLEAQEIQVLESRKSQGKLHVLLVAAGQEEAERLRNLYGPHLVVTSWLRHVSS